MAMSTRSSHPIESTAVIACPECQTIAENTKFARANCGHVYCCPCIKRRIFRKIGCFGCGAPLSLCGSADLILDEVTTNLHVKVSFLGLLADPEPIGEELQEIRISDLTSYIDEILTEGVALKPREVTRQEARAIKATAAEARRRFDKERVHLYELLGRQRQQIDELTGIHRKVTRDYQNLVEAFAFAAKWADAATQQELYRLSSAPQLPNEERGVVLARAI